MKAMRVSHVGIVMGVDLLLGIEQALILRSISIVLFIFDGCSCDQCKSGASRAFTSDDSHNYRSPMYLQWL